MRGIGAARAVLAALPRGAISVGTGLLVLGATSYAFLLVAARSTTPAAFAGLSVLYVLVYTLGSGLFIPFEQEVGRALADRRARGLGGGSLLNRAVCLAAAVLGALVVVAGAASPLITSHLFDGSWLLTLSLLISVVGLCAEYVSRGALAGTGQFGAYGTQLASEGGSRVLACGILAAAGVHAVGAYGLALAGGYVLAVAVTARRVPAAMSPGPDARWDELTGAIGWLVCGALLAQLLVNFGPVAVKLLAGSGQSQAAGQLLAGLVLARLPLFLFAAVQAALLPRLAALVARGHLDQFVDGIRRLEFVVVGLVGVTAVLMGALGPEVVRFMFGAKFHLGRVDLVELTIGTGLFMAATVLGNALLALQRFALAAIGWAAGVAVMFAVIAVHVSLYARVEHSLLLGALASTLVFGWLVRQATGARARPLAAHEPITDVVRGP